MTIISGLGSTTTIRTGQPRPAAAGFAVPSSASTAVSATVQVAAMPGLLAMQEAGQGTVRDRDARRHGAAMLAALAELQRALLGGDDGAALERLASLVRNAPPPADPALLMVQRAVLVRAAVELARRAAPAASR